MKTLIRLIAVAALALSFPAFAGTPAAKVGTRVITVEELQKTINSTPYGMPDIKQPDPGERRLILNILAEMINAELLYTEAVSLKIPESAPFKEEAARHKKGILADRYRQKIAAEAVVSPDAVKGLAKEKAVSEDTARSLLLNEQRRKALADESSRLFDHYKVQYSPSLAKTGIGKFKDTDELVTSAAFKIAFGDVKGMLRESGNTKDALLDILAQAVETELFATRAAELDLGKDAEADIKDYEKNLAVVLHRDRLNRKYAATKGEINGYLKKNGYLRYKPQVANALLMVLKSAQEATFLRDKVLHGGNFYELAANNSIAPNAKANAGRIDPIVIGEHPYSSIDKALLALKPGEMTTPIKGDKGYTIFQLLQITPRELRSAQEMKDQAARAVLEKKMAKHIAILRQSTTVEVYPAIQGAGNN